MRNFKWILGLSIDEKLEWALAYVQQRERRNDRISAANAYSEDSGARLIGGVHMSLAGDTLPASRKAERLDIQRQIITLIQSLKDDYPMVNEIEAVGVSTIGVVDRRLARLQSIKRKPWKSHSKGEDRHFIDFRTVIDKALGGKKQPIPVVIHNDVTAKCLAEYGWQEDPVIRLCYANISQGVNIGLIQDGHVDAPTSEVSRQIFHPELGHAYPPLNQADSLYFQGAMSGCPTHITCFEGIASHARILKQWNTSLNNLGKPERSIISHYIAHFCWMAAVAAAPDRILLGGLVPFEEFVEMVREDFDKLNSGRVGKERYISRWSRPKLKNFLQLARLGENASILGALELARDAIDRQTWTTR